MSDTSLTVIPPLVIRQRDPHAQGVEDALKEALHHAYRFEDAHLVTALRVAVGELRRAEERQREQRARWA